MVWLLVGGIAIGAWVGWRRRSQEVKQLARGLDEATLKLERMSIEENRQRGRLESMLKGLTAGVVAVDHQDRVQFVNPTFEFWCGRPEQEILGQSLLEVLRHHELAQVMTAAREKEAEQLREITLLGPVERTVDVRAAPLRLEGQASGAVAVLYDVTELRRLERVRQDFVANVSHELRTPLTAIRGAVETLMEGAAKDPKNREAFLTVVHDHTERLERLVEDLLSLSTVERQTTSLQMEAVSLKPLCDRVFSLHRSLAERQHVALENQLDDHTPPVRADPFRLEQALLNLVENAVKFSESGGRVWVDAQVQSDRLFLGVHDAGIGIPAKDLPRIFERFYRVDKARSRELGGTGLGLSLVKHIIEAHGGDVRIESEEGHGTTVWISLSLTPKMS